MITILLGILAILFVLFTSMIIHELGHFLYFKWVIGRDVEIRFSQDFEGKYRFKIGKPSDYDYLSKWQLIMMYMAGILAGLIPIIIAGIIQWWYYLLLIYYVYGCIPDLKNIKRLVQDR